MRSIWRLFEDGQAAELLAHAVEEGMTTGMKMEMITEMQGMTTGQLEMITVRLSGLVYSVLLIPRMVHAEGWW